MKKHNNDFNESELISKMNNEFSERKENKKSISMEDYLKGKVNIDEVFDTAVDNSFLGRLEKLKIKHEEVRNEYAEMFKERMGLDDDLAYFSGNVYCVCDYYVDIKTIVWAINHLIDEDKFFGWYDYNLFLGENNLGEITLEDYCKGKKKFSDADVDALKAARQRVTEAERNFEDVLYEITHKDGD